MSPVYLTVVRGPDAGQRLHLDREEQVIGRSRQADLILADVRVSRHHLRVTCLDDNARVELCPGAAPFLLNGAPTTHATLTMGDTLVVGDSALVLVKGDDSAGLTTNVDVLMTGLGADVRGLAAVFALVQELDAATDASSLQQTLADWAKLHADALDVAASFGRDASSSRNEIVVHSDDTTTQLTVPAHTDTPGWLTFRLELPKERITESLCRLLAVAGRICASRMAQLATLSRIDEERALFRRQAFGSAEAFLGTSAAAREVVKLIPRIAFSDVHVLIEGETGSGKTFVARLIHESGPRAKEPLRIINCASIPENLIESELFGHERGAFTGAVASRAGAFESAGRGTVLLDEIGELPLGSQAKLLRVLEDKRFERIGSNRGIALEARVLAATNRDLAAMVAEGTFRSDLYFRISVIKAWVPPLRERADDLGLLAERILGDLAPSAGRRVAGFTSEAMDLLRRYPWPGNVRELRNAIEHALVLGDGPLIAPNDFPSAVRCLPPIPSHGATSVVQLPANLEWLERRAIEEALRAADGNRPRAAALLGVKPAVLYYKLRQKDPPG